jgi:hypothetical protein
MTKIFYSGIGIIDACPETILGERSRIMLSYFRSVKRPEKRLEALADGTNPRPCEHFMDSGAFSLWVKSKSGYEFFRSAEFRGYLEGYVEFINRYWDVVDLYANADVLPGRFSERDKAEELSLRNQKWLERRGLKPVPVVHLGADVSWLDQYLDMGHDLISLGGLVGSITKDGCRRWIAGCFDWASAKGVRLHGFGLTNFRAITSFPWYSVDSAVWDRVSSYGGLLIPRLRREEYVFDEEPFIVRVSNQNPSVRSGDGYHYLSLPRGQQEVIDRWLEEAGGYKVPQLESDHKARRVVNLHYFDRFQEWLLRREGTATTISQGFRLVG